MIKKIVLILGLLLIPLGAVQSSQPFQEKSPDCFWCDPCDCCFDNVRIEIGDLVYTPGNEQNAYWNIEITPLKNRRPVNKVVAFDAYIYSSQYGYIYGSDAFYLDEPNFDNVYVSGIRLYDSESVIHKVIWQPGLDYEFRINGFNYDDTIHLMIVMPSGCVLMSDPMVFDFGSPPVPVKNP